MMFEGTPGILEAVGNPATSQLRISTEVTAPPLSDEAREYRILMRKWWFGAAVGVFTMIFS